MNAPNFCLKELTSRSEVRLSDFKGKPVMLTFWVSWCPDCQKDLPHKETFYRSLDKSKLSFLTINVTGREVDPEAGARFAKEHGLPFPVLLDDGTKTYDAFKCGSVPTTILIDREGRIVHQFGDKASFSEIIQALSSMMP
ncbi:TlpA disulfide reductase family protein [Camelliibacillus cellulosilyticus]|uniref:TlpA disulfide reductase family protein n=1 Tax=Camelliibacillus cellulosilyticus TaxID=2174486 RepID=A0ABV9GLI1_9BACL